MSESVDGKWFRQPKRPGKLDSLAGGFLFSLSIITVLELPVHDLTNHRSGHQAKQLQHAKDGRIQAH